MVDINKTQASFSSGIISEELYPVSIRGCDGNKKKTDELF